MRGQTETCGKRQDDLNSDQATKKKRTEGLASCWETSECRRRRGKEGLYIKAPHNALTVITENSDPSLVTQVWASDKTCLAIVDNRANVTVARPVIAAGWPETIQTANGIWRSAPQPVRSFSYYDPGMEPLENLGFRRQYHQ
jgi:hypothetical protein